MENSLMTHVVAGYPSKQKCLELILGMDKLGVGRIEVQIPFSDPIADGETIMRANDVALGNKMDTNESLNLIAKAKKQIKAEIYIMSYVQKIVHFGVEEFCARAALIGASGLIIPDLPYDAPEYKNLISATRKNSLKIVPVISPGILTQRLKWELENAGDLVYLTSRKGITGAGLIKSAELAGLCREVKGMLPQSKLAIGFGVQNKNDVGEILKIADIAVVGSAVIKEIEKSGVSGALKLISNLSS